MAACTAAKVDAWAAVLWPDPRREVIGNGSRVERGFLLFAIVAEALPC